jgi:hypothetical protein
MWFRLALKMGRTVDELQSVMSSAEFGEWVAYYSIEPFGERIDDLRTGTVASVVANVNRGKDTKPYMPLDFIPWAKEPVDEAPPPAENIAALFGVNLTEARKSGNKQIIIHRSKSKRPD